MEVSKKVDEATRYLVTVFLQYESYSTHAGVSCRETDKERWPFFWRLCTRCRWLHMIGYVERTVIQVLEGLQYTRECLKHTIKTTVPLQVIESAEAGRPLGYKNFEHEQWNDVIQVSFAISPSFSTTLSSSFSSDDERNVEANFWRLLGRFSFLVIVNRLNSICAR